MKYLTLFESWWNKKSSKSTKSTKSTSNLDAVITSIKNLGVDVRLTTNINSIGMTVHKVVLSSKYLEEFKKVYASDSSSMPDYSSSNSSTGSIMKHGNIVKYLSEFKSKYEKSLDLIKLIEYDISKDEKINIRLKKKSTDCKLAVVVILNRLSKQETILNLIDKYGFNLDGDVLVKIM
jgi:hypothetical protein